jgi:hypothetical protein
MGLRHGPAARQRDRGRLEWPERMLVKGLSEVHIVTTITAAYSVAERPENLRPHEPLT